MDGIYLSQRLSQCKSVRIRDVTKRLDAYGACNAFHRNQRVFMSTMAYLAF